MLFAPKIGNLAEGSRQDAFLGVFRGDLFADSFLKTLKPEVVSEKQMFPPELWGTARICFVRCDKEGVFDISSPGGGGLAQGDI